MKKQEIEWTQKKLIPLLRRLGFTLADSVHGPMEAGKDIVVADYDRFAVRRYFAIQVKDGDIRAQSETGEIITIINQAQTAHETPYRDPYSGTEHKVQGVYLVVNGAITAPARQILYTKTGGWFNIVDRAQLQVATQATYAIQHEERRIRLVAVSTEKCANNHVLEAFLPPVRSLIGNGRLEDACAHTERGLTLPVHKLKTRALQRYLDVGYHELADDDVAELETILQCAEAINYLWARLHVGPQDFSSLDPTLKSILSFCEIFLEKSESLQAGIDQLLDTDRPAPGTLVPEGVFTRSRGRQDPKQSE